MKRVAIVDYGMGNLDSVARAVEECGGAPVVTDQPAELNSVSAIILPGVGAFGDGMRNIRERGLEPVLRKQAAEARIPMLGLCLGMHLLADFGTEGGDTPGLGIVPGRVVRMVADQPSTRIPHVGWNEVRGARPSPLLDGIEDGKDFYFVHSYHFVCGDESDILGTTPYCGGIVSMVQRGSVAGVQFHPEKSQRVGFRLLQNFLGR